MTRLSSGFLYGVLTGIIKNVLDLFVYYGLGFEHHRYLDHASGIMLGRPVDNLFQGIYFLFIDIWFSGFMGIVFLYLIIYFTDNHYLFRGLLYGSILWFLIHSLGSILQIPTFEKMLLATLILHFVTDSIYGLSLAYVIHRQEQ